MRGVWGGESENHGNRCLASTQCVVHTLYVMGTLYQLSLPLCMKILYVAPTLGTWGGGISWWGVKNWRESFFTDVKLLQEARYAHSDTVIAFYAPWRIKKITILYSESLRICKLQTSEDLPNWGGWALKMMFGTSYCEENPPLST